MNLLDSSWILFLCSETANDSPMWGASSSISLLNSTRYAAASWQVSRCLGLELRTTSNPPTTHCAKGRFLGSFPAASETSQPELLPIIPRSSANHRSPRDSCAGAWCSWREGLEKYHYNSLVRVSFRRYSHFDQPRKCIYYHLLFMSIICCLFFLSNHSSLLNNPNPDVFLLVFLTNMCLKNQAHIYLYIYIYMYTYCKYIIFTYCTPNGMTSSLLNESPVFFSIQHCEFPARHVFSWPVSHWPGVFSWARKPGRQSRQSSASLEVLHLIKESIDV